MKKVFLKISQNSQGNICARIFFLINLHPSDWNYIKKETVAQVISCEFWAMFKKTFFTKHLWATATARIFKFHKGKVVRKEGRPSYISHSH